MDEFLLYLVKGICEKEDEVDIQKTETDYSVEFIIKVAENEYGQLIGRSGKTINSLKTLLNLYAFKKGEDEKKRIILKVKDSDDMERITITQTDSPVLDN